VRDKETLSAVDIRFLHDEVARKAPILRLAQSPPVFALRAEALVLVDVAELNGAFQLLTNPVVLQKVVLRALSTFERVGLVPVELPAVFDLHFHAAHHPVALFLQPESLEARLALVQVLLLLAVPSRGGHARTVHQEVVRDALQAPRRPSVVQTVLHIRVHGNHLAVFLLVEEVIGRAL